MSCIYLLMIGTLMQLLSNTAFGLWNLRSLGMWNLLNLAIPPHCSFWELPCCC